MSLPFNEGVVSFCPKCGSKCNVTMRCGYSEMSGKPIYRYTKTCPKTRWWHGLFDMSVLYHSVDVDFIPQGSADY